MDMHPEAKHERHQMSDMLYEIDAKAARAELVEAIAEDLMRDGEEFYPFSPDNLREAIEQSGPGVMSLLSAFLGRGLETGFTDDLANHGVAVSLREMAFGYWHKLALLEADRRVK